ncbi:MAG TPA: MFS transporter [Allosphingosinicella sp.]|nr:MFS transporter [Allosphingosinicella sp.]
MPAEAALDPPFRPAPDGWADLLAEGRAPVLALIVLGCWVVAADSLVTATIMPSVGAALDGYAWFGWAASAFLTGLVVAGASAGWLAERIGLRAAMMLAGAGFGLGCALSALAPGIGLFLAGRALQGCAAGWVCGLIYVALAILFPGRLLPRAFAILTSVWGVATFAGPLLGGLFADAGAWRGIFWLFAGQAALFTAASFVLIPADAARDARFALPAAPLVLLAVGIAAIATAGVAGGGAAPLLAATGIGLLVAALAADRAGPNGLLPRRAADPAFPLGAAWLTYFCTTAAGTAFALYAPALLQHRAGLSALEAGYVVAVEALAWTAASLSVAGAGPAWRARLIVIGPASILAGVTGITLVTPAGSLAAVAGAGALLGAGFGLSYSFISQRVIGAFDEGRRARGAAAIGAVRNAGGALGAALAGIAANAAGFGDGLSDSNLAAVAWGAFGSGIPFALLGLFCAIRLARAQEGDSPRAGTVPGV